MSATVQRICGSRRKQWRARSRVSGWRFDGREGSAWLVRSHTGKRWVRDSVESHAQGPDIAGRRNSSASGFGRIVSSGLSRAAAGFADAAKSIA